MGVWGWCHEAVKHNFAFNVSENKKRIVFQIVVIISKQKNRHDKKLQNW